MRSAQKLLMPGGLILLAALLVAYGLDLPERVSPLVRIIPGVIFSVGILLGARFHSVQMVLALVALAIIDVTLAFFAPHDFSLSDLESDLTTALFFLLPLNFILLCVRPPRGVLSPASGARLALLLVPPLVIGWLAIESPGLLTSLLDQRWLDIDRQTGTAMTQPAWAAFAAAFVILLTQQIFGRNSIAGAMFWALASALFALNALPQSAGIVVFLSTAGAILIVSQVESNYLLAFRDDLTELPSRRALDQALSRLGRHYTIAMLDIDHFKKFNDTHGHQVGDQVLRMVGFKLAGITGGGTAFRYGGEEFALVFPGKRLEETASHIQALMEAIRSTPFTIRGQRLGPEAVGSDPDPTSPQQVFVTVSIGVSGTQTPTDILRQADRAVYMAKAGGRDRMVMVSDDEPPQAQPTDAPPKIPRRVEPSRKTRPTSWTKKKAV